MTPQELQNFLHLQIPMARALDVSVVEANDLKAVVRSPLEPNRNHLGTAFGGSLGALLILSGYTWLYHAMETRGHHVHVLLRKCETDYRAPVDTELIATAHKPADFQKFLKTFEAKGRARVTIHSEISDHTGDAVCFFEGIFVAQKAAASRLS